VRPSSQPSAPFSWIYIWWLCYTYPMAVDVKQIIQELIVLELREIKAEVKNVQTEIKRLEEKIDLHGARLEDKIDA